MPVSQKICLLVLGMHRSGTSALTHAASLAGFTLPTTLMSGKADNLAGHWESQKLVDFHDNLLTKLGSQWDDFRELDASVLSEKDRNQFSNEFKKILQSEYGDASHIVIKDPPICRFSGFYVTALENLGYDVKILSIIRNPIEVAASLTRRNKFSDTKSILLWLRHVLDAEYETRGWQRSFIFHDAFIKHPTKIFRQSIKRVKYETSQTWPAVKVAIETHIKSELRHHENTRDDIEAHKLTRSWALETYQALHGNQAGRLEQKNHRILDDIRMEFNSAIEFFHSMQASIERLENKNTRLTNDKYQVKENLKQAEKTIQTLTATVSHRDADIKSLKGSIKTRDKRIKSLDKKIEKARGEISQAQKEIKKTYDIITHRDHDIHALTQQLREEAALNAFHREQFLAVISSTSWRVMKGPRWIVRQIKAFPRRVYNTLTGRVFYNRIRRWSQKHGLETNMRTIRNARQALAQDRESTLGANWHRAMLSAAQNQMDLPSVTLSIVTYNSQKWLADFLHSVEALDYPLNRLSLHFVDHGSQDDTQDVLRAYIKQKAQKFRSIALSERPNLGYGMGNDYAIKESDDDFVLVTNVDTAFYPESLKRAVITALNDDAETACWEFRQAPYEHPKYYDPVTLLTNWCSHACVLMRRYHYLKVGGYEPRIFMYGEDVELSYRFRAHGFKLRYVPKAVITHHVDLEDATVRPLQLSGSIAANVLLRYRFGTWKDILAGEIFFRGLKLKEIDAVRRDAFDRAAKDIRKHRGHFFRKRRILKNMHFPFQGFDYDLARPGAGVVHQPYPEDQDKLPIISIITRTHGSARQHLDNAIASVLNQTYSHIEHIIVEDRTDDAESRVSELEALYPGKLRYVRSTQEAGRSACGNYGARRAKGRYLCWLDNDDMLFADHVELLVRGLEQNRRAVCSYALAWDSRSSVENDTPVEISFELPDVHNQPYDSARLEQENFIPIQSIIFRKSLFKKYGGFNTEFDALEDWNLWVRYAQAGPFVFTPKVTSLYRTPDNEIERQKRHMILHAAYETVAQTNAKEIAEIRRTR